jgi:hypothetical protein
MRPETCLAMGYVINRITPGLKGYLRAAERLLVAYQSLN